MRLILVALTRCWMLKVVNSVSRKDIFFSKIRLYANYFFRNGDKYPFRTFMGNIGKLTKNKFAKTCFWLVCTDQMHQLKNDLKKLILEISKQQDIEQREQLFQNLILKLKKYDFRGRLQQRCKKLKTIILKDLGTHITVDDIDARDLIKFLDSKDTEIKGWLEQCQKIIDDADKLRVEFQQKFNDGAYDEMAKLFQNFHLNEFNEFIKTEKAIVNSLRFQKVCQESKRIFFTCDFSDYIADDGVEALTEFDKDLITKLVESACDKFNIKDKNEIAI